MKDEFKIGILILAIVLLGGLVFYRGGLSNQGAAALKSDVATKAIDTSNVKAVDVSGTGKVVSGGGATDRSSTGSGGVITPLYPLKAVNVTKYASAPSYTSAYSYYPTSNKIDFELTSPNNFTVTQVEFTDLKFTPGLNPVVSISGGGSTVPFNNGSAILPVSISLSQIPTVFNFQLGFTYTPTTSLSGKEISIKMTKVTGMDSYGNKITICDNGCSYTFDPSSNRATNDIMYTISGLGINRGGGYGVLPQQGGYFLGEAFNIYGWGGAGAVSLNSFPLQITTTPGLVVDLNSTYVKDRSTGNIIPSTVSYVGLGSAGSGVQNIVITLRRPFVNVNTLTGDWLDIYFKAVTVPAGSGFCVAMNSNLQNLVWTSIQGGNISGGNTVFSSQNVKYFHSNTYYPTCSY